MRRFLPLVMAAILSLCPTPALGLSGSPGYGDPPGWCTRFSDMWPSTVVTNDPTVPMNPERNTFSGFHPDPGYDDWYGFFYGDFRGRPGDASGWVYLLHEIYPHQYSWNFANNGWAVHGHVKQYIAYYNWTFGGQCGIGRYGSLAAPPFMADQVGWPVVDFYVDSVPPYPPAPRVVATAPASVTFGWDPVADRGDGAGIDYFVSGIDHYTSWITVDGGPPQQLASTAAPRTLGATVLPHHEACVHVEAVDRAGNLTPEQVACGQAIGAPPMPAWPAVTSSVLANPSPVGLVGLDTWLWLDPQPRAMVTSETSDGVQYQVTATPTGAQWSFDDGSGAAAGGFGARFPEPSPITHVFQAHSEQGYEVRARVDYAVTWRALVNGIWAGPYPMGTAEEDAQALRYPVEQAQPELLRLGA